MREYLFNPGRKEKLKLLTYDAFVVLGVFLSSYALRVFLYEGRDFEEFLQRISWLVLLGILVHVISFYVFGLYDQARYVNRKVLFIGVFLSIVVASGGVAMLSFAFPKYQIGRILIGTHVVIMVGVVFLWRVLYAMKTGAAKQRNMVMVGWNGISKKIVDKLGASDAGYRLKGLVIPTGEPRPATVGNPAPVYDSLETGLDACEAEAAVFCRMPEKLGQLGNFLVDLKFKGLEVFDGPGFYERLSGRVPVSEISERWLLLSGSPSLFQPAIYKHLKRFLDIAISTIVLLMFSPLLGLLAVFIKMDSKGPVLFRQERLGQNEKPFMLLKFRTMVDDAERHSGPRWASEDDERFTRLGKFLRKTHLDELPQFINVLRGDMSLVGPRPIRRHFADIFSEKFPFYRLRFKVRPGITGWAQVNMNYVNTEQDQYEKLEYEMYYIYHQSIFLDIFIILKTIQSMLRMRGGDFHGIP